MKTFAVWFLLVAAMGSASPSALACGSHGVCGGGYGGYYPGRLVGGGAVAFRRGRRLQRRAFRAAWFGFYGRANRLQWRANAAFGRSAFRAGRFYGRRCCY